MAGQSWVYRLYKLEVKRMELIQMTTSRKKPKQHDVFAFQPKEGMFLFGYVARVNIVNTHNAFMNGWNLVYITNLYSKTYQMPALFQPTKLLTAPSVINNQGWLKGYFETVGNCPIDPSIAEGYGFKNSLGKYLNEEGKVLEFVPFKWGVYGLGNHLTVTEDLETVFDSGGDKDLIEV